MKLNYIEIKGYEGLYSINSLSQVMNIKRGKHISQWEDNGYMKVTLNKKGKKNFLVHRLMYEAFVGPIPEGMQINHINGVKICNFIENLEVVTPLQNTRHAIDMGLFDPKSYPKAHGESHAFSKLTEAIVYELDDLYATGKYTYKQLGEMFGVYFLTIRFAIRRITWKHLPKRNKEEE